jgi:hypothetical protein
MLNVTAPLRPLSDGFLQLFFRPVQIVGSEALDDHTG